MSQLSPGRLQGSLASAPQGGKSSEADYLGLVSRGNDGRGGTAASVCTGTITHTQTCPTLGSHSRAISPMPTRVRTHTLVHTPNPEEWRQREATADSGRSRHSRNTLSTRQEKLENFLVVPGTKLRGLPGVWKKQRPQGTGPSGREDPRAGGRETL